LRRHGAGAACAWAARGGPEGARGTFSRLCGDLERAGAARTRAGLDIIFERPGYDSFPQRDLGFVTFCLSRPLLESVCRRRLMDEPNVDLRPRTRVSEILPSDDGAVAAARYDDEAGRPETLAADLVVDVSGRTGLTLGFLERISSPKQDVAEIGIDMGYATAFFEISGNAPTEWMGVAHLPVPSNMSRGGFIFPMEDGR